MSIRIQIPQSTEALTEFVHLQDQVYEYRSARWPALTSLDIANLTGDSVFTKHREMRPFMALDGDRIVARALAIMDRRYIRHWNQPLGNLAMFEALPGTEKATAQLVDAACEWLQQQGMEAARAGTILSPFDNPFAIDSYDMLPNLLDRQNPPYYHALLKNAGFESEHGWLDYHIEVRPALVAQWREALASAQRSGCRIVSLHAIQESKRASTFTFLLNDTFQNHWGWHPLIEEEADFMLTMLGPGGMLDTSAIAYKDNEPVGIVFVLPSDTSGAILKPGRELAGDEKLNSMAIGVRKTARGQGLAAALASYAFLELARMGATHVAYPLVLDDNWASRRVGERLGGVVRANWMTYRRNFNH